MELSLIEAMDCDNISNVLKKIYDFQCIIQGQLKRGHDFDVVPGTNKPSLLKAGAEKINMLFGVNPEYTFIDKIEDFEAEFFTYNIRCTLYKNGLPVAQGVGSCNSKEKKYRYTNVYEKDLPLGIDKENVEAIKDKYGKTKYKIGNPDICSLVNTILKMAKKRAYVDATLQLAALSEIFTQDLEDLKDFANKESMENMSADDALNVVVNFGKHKGLTLREIKKSYPAYIEWIIKNSTDATMVKACTLINPPKDEDDNEYSFVPPAGMPL